MRFSEVKPLPLLNPITINESRIPHPASHSMTLYDILGLPRDATPDEIRAAYRMKMASAHPDRGGSHNEAARLTAARDRLLKKKR